MTTPVAPPSAHHRPLLGLRREPGRIALMFMRMPLRAYRHNAGWMLGHTFLEFTHLGRKTGRTYEAVAMVLHHDETTGEAVICAAWGPDTDWYRNLRAHPAPRVQFGRAVFTPEQRFLTDAEAFDIAVKFRAAHPRRLALLSRILGWDNLHDDANVRAFIRTHPFIAFRPASPQRAHAS